MTTSVVIPNGGWGWVIVGCSFLIHMFVVGTIYALSVLYVAWLEHFQNSKGLTSWIISLAVAVMFAIGPLPGSLTKKFGNRVVVIIGGLVTAIGFFSSCFAPNVYYLVVSIGLVTGTGAGCCFLPSVSLVALYFTTKRSLAMGIAASGLGVGAFFMAPFLNWLESFYGWRGTMLILSGISLNMCVLGFLMRPIETAPNVKFSKLCCRKCTRSHEDLTCAESNLDTNEDEKCPMNDGEDGHFTVKSYTDKPPNIVGDGFQKRPLPLENYATRKGSKDSCKGLPVGETLQENNYYTAIDRKPLSNAKCLDKHLGESDHKLIQIIDEDTSTRMNPPDYTPKETCTEYHQLVNLQSENVRSSFERRDSPKNTHLSTSKTSSATNLTNINCVNTNHQQPNAERKLSDVSCPSNDSGHTKILPGRRRAQTMIGTRGAASLQTLPSAIDRKRKPYSSSSELSARDRYMSSSQSHSIPLSRLNDLQEMLASSISSFIFVNGEFTSLLSVVSKPSLVTDHSDIGKDGLESNMVLLEDGVIPGDEATKKDSTLIVYIRLLRHYQFLWFCVSNLLTNLSFFMPVLYMVDRAIDNGIPKSEAAMLISLYGAGNIIGKLFLGWLADRGFVDRLFYYISCLGLSGIATCLSPMCGALHWLHAIYGFAFGFFIGGYVTLFPIVTVDLLGLSDIGEAVGLLLAFMGVGIVLGTPVAGWIFDMTGSYTMSFILHGALIVFSAAMLVPLLLMKHKHRLPTLKFQSVFKVSGDSSC